MQNKKPLEFSKLQKICQAISNIKQQIIGERPHYRHQSLYWHNDEITTGILDNTIEIKIHLAVGKILYHENETGYYIDITDNSEDINQKLQNIASQHNIKTNFDKMYSPTQNELDEYRFFAYQANKILTILQMNLTNRFTQVQLWPHHFDFSVKWFRTKNSKQYIETGISPGDTQYPMPYMYMNPWPFNEKELSQIDLPLEGTLHTKDWSGIKIEWSELIQHHPKETAQYITTLHNTITQTFND